MNLQSKENIQSQNMKCKLLEALFNKIIAIILQSFQPSVQNIGEVNNSLLDEQVHHVATKNGIKTGGQAKYFEKLGKTAGKRLESNKIRKVPDRQYFDIWRFSFVGYKVHEGKHFDEEHLIAHIEEQRLGDKHVKQLREIQKWVMSESLFSKKLKNDEMHYLSNKIRKIIEVLGVFKKRNKTE